MDHGDPGNPSVFEQEIDSQAKSVLISLNPKSGSSDRTRLIEQLAAALQDAGFETQIFQNVDKLCDAVAHLQPTGQLKTVVSAGGDGTASLLLNRLPAGVPLTIFPLGTANLLAKYLQVRADVPSVVSTITTGKTIDLDVGQANDKLFLVVASCGFDADVVDRIHRGRRGHISYWSYGLPIIRSIQNYRFPKMQLRVDGQSNSTARWAFICNLPQYAMNLQFVQEADGQDGLLDLCTFRGGGFFTGLFYFFAVLFRRHRHISATQFSRFRELAITSSEPIPIELDGDPGGHLPVTIRVIPKRLRVLVSDQWRDGSANTAAEN